MTRFVKLRRRAKNLMLLIAIFMIIFSSIVSAVEPMVIDRKSTTYTVLGKEVIVIEGERPEGEALVPNIFYAEDDASIFYEAYINNGNFEFITQEEFNNYSSKPEEYENFSNQFNKNYLENKINGPGPNNFQTVEDIFELSNNNYIVGGIMNYEKMQGISTSLERYGIEQLTEDPVYNPEGFEVGSSNNSEEEATEEEPQEEDTETSLGGLLGGIISVFMNILRYIPVVIATGLGKIVSTIGAAITGQDLANGLTLDAILFNRVELTKIDFFSTSTDNTVNAIRDNVAVWYVGIRNLSAVILSAILLYVGIRMAISSVAEDKARYKNMLFNWVVSLALLFLLHYIMQATITVNNSLVNIMQNTTATDIEEGAQKFDDVMNMFMTAAYDWNVGAVNGIAYALIYLLLTIMTFLFLLIYLKRMITIAFLIMIAPIITITYSIDKMGDGKSQALNTWLKEFIYNVLIQPFHCIIYLALVNSSFEILDTTGNVDVFDGLVTNNIGPAVFCFMVVIFMYKAEDIVKNIFNFKASSMPESIAKTALFATAIDAIGKQGKKVATVSNKTRKNTPNYSKNGKQDNTRARNQGTQNASAAQNNQRETQANENTPPSGGGNQNPQPSPAETEHQNGQGPQNGTGNQRTTTGRGRKVISGVKKVGGAILKNTVKATGYAVGLTLGAATGNTNVAISSMKAIGGATSDFMNNQKIKSNQRNLAKTYNNFASEHPELDEKSRIAFSRKLLDQEIKPQTDAEREYVEAMRDMGDIYEQDGLSSDEAADKVEKTIEKIQDGEISEISAIQRYRAQANNQINRYRNRTRSNSRRGNNR